MSDDTTKLDRSVFEIADLRSIGSDKAYWQSKTCAERMVAAARIREVLYGHEATTRRLQRFFEVADLK